MYIPCIVPLREDETLASWICHLAKDNGFENVNEFARYFLQPLVKCGKFRYLKVNDLENFSLLYQRMQMPEISMRELYLMTTCYGGLAPFLSDGRRIHYLNASFRIGVSENEFCSASASILNELRFCPQCRTEEAQADGWYYHRAHQIPGVRVCHKHGCGLYRYTGSVGHWFDEDAQSEPCISDIKPWERNYAQFAKRLLELSPDIDYEAVKAAVLDNLSKHSLLRETMRRL